MNKKMTAKDDLRINYGALPLNKQTLQYGVLLQTKTHLQLIHIEKQYVSQEF